eukprot:3213653-Pleurochrysis_carterae.AAC.4
MFLCKDVGMIKDRQPMLSKRFPILALTPFCFRVLARQPGCGQCDLIADDLVKYCAQVRRFLLPSISAWSNIHILTDGMTESAVLQMRTLLVDQLSWLHPKSSSFVGKPTAYPAAVKAAAMPGGEAKGPLAILHKFCLTGTASMAAEGFTCERRPMREEERGGYSLPVHR